MPYLVCNRCGTDIALDSSTVECPECGKTYDGLADLSGGSPAPTTAKLSEQEVQRRVVELYESVGCTTYKTSVWGRQKGTSKGIPDLLVFAPGGSPLGHLGMWFHEVKPTDDPDEARKKQRPAQARFEERCERVGVVYLLGGVQVAAEHLGLEVSGIG